MSRRQENFINGVRMYSDVIEIDKIPPKQNVEYYRKVQKTTSRTVYEDGKKPQHKEETKTYVERSNNLNQKSGQFVPTSNYRNNISGSKYNNLLNQKNQTNSKNYNQEIIGCLLSKLKTKPKDI